MSQAKSFNPNHGDDTNPGWKSGAGQAIPAPARMSDGESPITPSDVHAVISRHMLADGFDLVIDFEKSRGSRFVDARSGKRYLDFFTFFASSAIGFNHPSLFEPSVQHKLTTAAVNKPSNSDVYCVGMAECVNTFSRVAIPDYLPHLFFVDGGALAVENALKTAFDWKIRKNFRKGHKTERGTQIIHFRHAFHGRSGYTLSLTNTDPTKTKYFPKFSWPRIDNPAIQFPLNDENLARVIREEQKAVDQIKKAILDFPDDIAGLIIEPIQAEGGDKHFRKEFLVELRRLCDENEILLIFDEIQTGVGITGKMWAHEHFVKPDLMAFGKKTHVCGFLAGPRIDEEPENVFKVSSRINSTFGGNLVDMVRLTQILKVIEEEQLVSNAARVGINLQQGLASLQEDFPQLVSNVRGRGLMCAFDLPDGEVRNECRLGAFKEGLLILGCGERSIRFRPALNVSTEEIEEGIDILRKVLKSLAVQR